MLEIFSFVFKSSICKMKESFWSELGYDLWLMMSSPNEPLCLEKPLYLYLLGLGLRNLLKTRTWSDRCLTAATLAAVWQRFGSNWERCHCGSGWAALWTAITSARKTLRRRSLKIAAV